MTKLVFESDNTVTIDGKKTPRLTNKEISILKSLCRRPGNTISKEKLMSDVYGGLDEPELKIIDVFICKVRAKIGKEIIKTTWGQGYRIPESVEISYAVGSSITVLLDEEHLTRLYDLAGINNLDVGDLTTAMMQEGIEAAEKKTWAE